MIYEFAQSTFLHAPDLMMVKDNVAGWEKEDKRMVRLENRSGRGIRHKNKLSSWSEAKDLM